MVRFYVTCNISTKLYSIREYLQAFEQVPPTNYFYQTLQFCLTTNMMSQELNKEKESSEMENYLSSEWRKLF